ncbi:MAG: hemoglobin/transferrin/lactoferrin receptor protein [Candidatus Endobugula sp.]|jgi:hemoglobin/transferrin/lactoferrin receptor protein
MIRFFFFFFCFSLISLVQAQTLIIENEETNEPIEMATVSSNEPFLFAITNGKGEADISDFVGVSVIEIRSVGFENASVSFSDIQNRNFEIKLNPSSFSLDDVVVSATKWRQSNKEIPGKISRISAKDVVLQNPQTTADLLASSGEVFIQKSQQGGGSPMIRGFSSNRLLYTVDGVRMNTAIFRSGNVQNVISLDAFATENTEIMFGPGSVIYGSDAIGGVMSFTTLTPQFSSNDNIYTKGSALTRFASANNELSAHFDVNVGWKKIAMLTSFSYSNFDDLKMGGHGPDEYLRPSYVQRQDTVDVLIANDNPLKQIPTAYSQMNFMQKLAFKPNKHWDLTYAFHYSESSNYGRYDRHIRYHNGLPRSAEWDYGPQKWMMNQLTIAYKKTNVAFDEMNIRLAHQYFNESRIERDFNDPIRSTKEEKVFAYSVNMDFVKRITEQHKIFYGAEFVNNVVQSEAEALDIVSGQLFGAAARYPMAAWATAGVYASYQYKASDKFNVQAGLRYAHFLIEADFTNNLAYFPLPQTEAKLSKGSATGSLGAIYSPSSNTSVRANFSTGFRAPNIDDIGKIFDSEPGSVLIPNTNLQAEYVYNGEIGFAQIIKKNLKIDATAYYTYLQNAMVRRDFTFNGQDSINYQGERSQVQAIQNAANANVYGVQLGIEAKLPQGFGLNAVYNYQKGTEELADGTNSASRHAAPMFGAAHLTFKHKGLFMDLYTLFSGGVSFENLPEEEKGKAYIYAIDDNGNPYSPAWATLNLKTSYRVNKNFSVSAGMENILDQRYKTYSSGIAAAGRNFIISGRVSF